jgi:hypothetical protein
MGKNGGKIMTFVELFGRKSAQAKLLDFLADHVGTIYSWNEIKKNNPKIKKTMMNRLNKAGLIVKGNAGTIYYRINEANPLVREMLHEDFERGKKAAEKEAKK